MEMPVLRRLWTVQHFLESKSYMCGDSGFFYGAFFIPFGALTSSIQVNPRVRMLSEDCCGDITRFSIYVDVGKIYLSVLP